MKRSLTILTAVSLALATVSSARAGDREWATAGKILAGAVVGATLVAALQPVPVCATPPVVVALPPPPLVVTPAPVVVAPPPVVVAPPPVVVAPAPVVVRPRPVVMTPAPRAVVHVRVARLAGPHRHCR